MLFPLYAALKGLKMADAAYKRLDALGRLGYARHKVRRIMPYLTPALEMLTPVPAPWLPASMGISRDGKLYWHPLYWEDIGEDDGIHGVSHEIMHIILKTVDRAEENAFDAFIANVAHDIIINAMLREAGIPSEGEWAKGLMWPERFGLEPDCHNHMTFEQVYAHVVKNPPPMPQWPNGKLGRPGEGWCGSGAGMPLDGEPTPQKTKKDSHGYRGRSEADLERMRKAVAEAVQREAGKGRGNVPAGMELWADAALGPPKVRWQDKVKRVSRGAIAYRPGAVIETYTVVGHMQAGLGFGEGAPRVPGFYTPSPSVLYVIDTSGSMLGGELELALRETSGVFSQLGVTDIDCVSCDMEIGGTGKARSWQEVARQLKGGGGTSFIPPFEYVQKLAKKPDLMIFATDGWGPAPAEPPPGITVIWLLVGADAEIPTAAGTGTAIDWGEMIRVKD